MIGEALGAAGHPRGHSKRAKARSELRAGREGRGERPQAGAAAASANDWPRATHHSPEAKFSAAGAQAVRPGRSCASS